MLSTHRNINIRCTMNRRNTELNNFYVNYWRCMEKVNEKIVQCCRFISKRHFICYNNWKWKLRIKFRLNFSRYYSVDFVTGNNSVRKMYRNCNQTTRSKLTKQFFFNLSLKCWPSPQKLLVPSGTICHLHFFALGLFYLCTYSVISLKTFIMLNNFPICRITV